MIEVSRKRGESLSAMLRRFNRKVQQSGILLEARKSKFYQRPKSHKLKKRSALRREEIETYRDYLMRIGKLGPEEPLKVSASELKRYKKSRSTWI